jgi:hypothetical protein
MKRVEVKLNLEAVAPLLDVIKGAIDDLRGAPAIGLHVPDREREFAEGWTEELVKGQNDDLGVLLRLFGKEFFTDGVIALDPLNAEAVVRACAAVRLKLRERHFAKLDDETLESGDINLDAFPEKLRIAFAAYVFLSTLQEVIIQHLDPGATE